MDLDHLKEQITVAMAHDFDKMIAPLADVMRREWPNEGTVKEVTIGINRMVNLSTDPRSKYVYNLEFVYVKPTGGLGRHTLKGEAAEEYVRPNIFAPIVASLNTIPDTKLGAAFYVDLFNDPDYFVDSVNYQLSDIYFNFHYTKKMHVNVVRQYEEVLH